MRVRQDFQPKGPRQQSGNSGSGSAGSGGQEFKHWGSQLSLESDVSVRDLRSRTLRPVSPSTIRRSRANTPVRATTPAPAAKPPLPDLRYTEAGAPRLADYLERPRVVSTFQHGINPKPRGDLAAAQRAKFDTLQLPVTEGRPAWRNLRLGYFLENGEQNGEIIPEMLREYYKDTYFTNRL